jgi:hypothetical protein
MDLSKAFDCLPQLIMVDENENWKNLLIGHIPS